MRDRGDLPYLQSSAKVRGAEQLERITMSRPSPSFPLCPHPTYSHPHNLPQIQQSLVKHNQRTDGNIPVQYRSVVSSVNITDMKNDWQLWKNHVDLRSVSLSLKFLSTPPLIQSRFISLMTGTQPSCSF